MRITATLLVAATALGAAACGGKSEEGGKQGDLKAGPGVTAKTIKLGVMSDLSGVFGALGKPLVRSIQLYWEQQNQRGGVCGRKVQLVIKDHGYNPQNAVAQYRELEPDIAGLQHLLGSPVAAALLPILEKDKLYTGLAAWPPSLLPRDIVQITGGTYDIDMVNGVDYLIEKGMLKQGDAVGHVYFEGDYGEGALLGSKYAAKQHGLKLTEAKIKPTDTDLAAAAATFRRAGVKAILASAGPAQTASVAGVALAQGLDVPIMSNGPGFAPQLLGTPAAAALEKNLYIVGPLAPYSLDKPGPTAVREAWEKKYPKDPAASVSVDYGWAAAQVMTEVLKKACSNKDLTREGLVKALHQLSGITLDGLVAGPLDYTKVGEPPSRAVYIARVAPKQPGGTETVAEGYESENAKGYKPEF